MGVHVRGRGEDRRRIQLQKADKLEEGVATGAWRTTIVSAHSLVRHTHLVCLPQR